jgi:hypothetical protein
MPKLLSGSTLRAGGSNTFINLAGAQPQLPESPTTSTGYTLVTDALLRTSYRSSLGNLEMNSGTIFSNIPNGNITLAGTGTGFVYVSSSTASTSTTSGALVVRGGIGVGGGIWTAEDIHVNGLTIGQGYKGLNNIVISGTASPQINDFSEGQESIAIGYDALLGLTTSYKSIAIGRYALSSGTEIRNSIAIGDSALKETGSIASLPIGSITTITQSSPAVLTVPGHLAITGTHVVISGVVGMTEVNDLRGYVKVINASTLELYSNINVSTPVDSTSFTPYTSGGTVSRLLERDNNIAIGNNAGSKLVDGKQNFFFGDGVAANLTTGSYNFFIGHEVGQNITKGSGIIGIGGDNLVNGVDDQVNIGSVFYYNGAGLLELMSDTEVGIGTTAGTDTAALFVIGGANIQDNLIVSSTLNSTSTNSGAFIVAGGAGIAKDLYVGGIIYGTINTTTNIAGGVEGSIPFQTSTGTTLLLPIGTVGQVLLSDGARPYWEDPTGSGGGGVGIISTASQSVLVSTATSSTVYYLGLNELIGSYSFVDSDPKLSYITTSSSTSSYYAAGTNVLTVPGNIYSATGNPDEGNLLYSPRVLVSPTAPTTPRVGDFWINSSNGTEFQWIKDGTSYFWVQFTGI